MRNLWPMVAHWWTGIHIQRYRKAIVETESYREILCKRYPTYTSVMWVENDVSSLVREERLCEGKDGGWGVLLVSLGLLVLVSVFIF